VRCVAPWPAEFEKPAAIGLTTPLGRWEFPAATARLQAEGGGSRPAFRRRSRSARWQIPEIRCPSHRGCERKRGSQAAIEPTSAAHFPPSDHACRAPHRAELCVREHLRGQMFGKSAVKPGNKTKVRPSRTAKQARGREFPVAIFAVYSLSGNPPSASRNPQKCKLLLHLGNSRAFFVDNKLALK